MGLQFDPGSWQKAAAALVEEATAFQQAGTSALSTSSDVSLLGAAGGTTVADQALATVLPPVFNQVGQTITALAEGLGDEAALMQATALPMRRPRPRTPTSGTDRQRSEMAMMLPGWLTEALQLVGYEWPSTNEDTLHGWAESWTALSDRSGGQADEIEQGVAYVAGANEGHGTEAFTSYMRGDSNLAALRDFATATGMLGQACDVGASIIVTLKVAVIGQLALLAGSIVAAVASGGIASAAVLLAREVARRLIDAALNLAVAEIMGT